MLQVVLLLLVKSAHSATHSARHVNGTNTAIRWGARTAPQPDGSVVFDWPAVYATFTARKATAVTMTMTDTTPKGTTFSILADGKRIQKLATRPGRQTYSLFPQGWEFEKHKKVVLTVMHTQEPLFINTDANHNLTLHYFETDGQIVAAPYYKRKMEFIGDSVLTGFGAGGLFPCTADLTTNDATVTFAQQLCSNMSADCSVVSGRRGFVVSLKPLSP